MTMLTNVPRNAAPTVRTAVRVLSAQVSDLVNRWVAAALVRRQRQAELVVQRYLRDRGWRDIGVNRSRIGDGPARSAGSPRAESDAQLSGR